MGHNSQVNSGPDHQCDCVLYCHVASFHPHVNTSTEWMNDHRNVDPIAKRNMDFLVLFILKSESYVIPVWSKPLQVSGHCRVNIRSCWEWSNMRSHGVLVVQKQKETSWHSTLTHEVVISHPKEYTPDAITDWGQAPRWRCAFWLGAGRHLTRGVASVWMDTIICRSIKPHTFYAVISSQILVFDYSPNLG